MYNEHYCGDQRNHDALIRLCESEVAKHAWFAIHEELTQTNELDEFSTIAGLIGYEAALAKFDHDNLQTRAQIQSAGEEAAILTDRLCELIRSKASLSLEGLELQGEDEAVALDVVCVLVEELVRDSQTNETLASWLRSWEARREELSQNRLEDPHLYLVMQRLGPWLDRCNKLKPAESRTLGDWALDAVATLEDKSGWSNTGFIERLENFAEFANESAKDSPAVPNPKTAKAPQRIFANALSFLMVRCLGTPHAGLVAALASAVFDGEVDEENVKKWWQRDRLFNRRKDH